ncbi:MAG: hypothetical protein LC650_01300 [Actinobacteria bacterium]|nr:hypothetical protein [Actinomycetota bacterium]
MQSGSSLLVSPLPMTVASEKAKSEINLAFEKEASWLSYARGARARLLPPERLARIDYGAAQSFAAFGGQNASLTRVFEITRLMLDKNLKFENDGHLLLNSVRFIYHLAWILSKGKADIAIFGNRTYSVEPRALMAEYPGHSCLTVAVRVWNDLHAMQETLEEAIHDWNWTMTTDDGDLKKGWADNFWIQKDRSNNFEAPILYPESYQYSKDAPGLNSLDFSRYTIPEWNDEPTQGLFDASLVTVDLQAILQRVDPSDTKPKNVKIVVKTGDEQALTWTILLKSGEGHSRLADALVDLLASSADKPENDKANNLKSVHIGFLILWPKKLNGKNKLQNRQPNMTDVFKDKELKDKELKAFYNNVSRLLVALENANSKRLVMLWPWKAMLRSFPENEGFTVPDANNTTLNIVKNDNLFETIKQETLEVQGEKNTPSLLVRHLNVLHGYNAATSQSPWPWYETSPFNMSVAQLNKATAPSPKS